MSREVLSPPLQRLDNNRFYRVNLVHPDFAENSTAFQKQKQKAMQSHTSYVEEDLYSDEDANLDDETNKYVIEELPNSMFQATLNIANSFYGGIIGFKGHTKQRIEKETKTEIVVPRFRPAGYGKQSGEIKINGNTRQSVCAACQQVVSLVDSMRKRMRPTHFLGIKLNCGEIREKFLEIKKEILTANLPGIEESLFQTVECVHLTLCVCLLLDDKERAQAVELLQSCREYVDELKTPLTMKVSGLEIFHDDPSAVRVLFARIDAPELQQFANSVNRRFIKSGLSFDQHNRDGVVKLHMTVMNSSFRKSSNSNAASNFDAREILKRFGHFDFGTTSCDEVHLCILGSKKENEFYKITSTLKLNKNP